MHEDYQEKYGAKLKLCVIILGVGSAYIRHDPISWWER